MALAPAAIAAAGDSWEGRGPAPLPSSPSWFQAGFPPEGLAAPPPGLTVGWYWRGSPQGPVMVHYVKVDPAHGLRLRPVVGQRPAFSEGLPPIRGVETVSSMAQRVGALAAINGTYFDMTGLALGLLVVEGQWLTQPVWGRTALGWNDEGRWVMDRVDFQGQVIWPGGRVSIDGYNRPRRPGEVVVYTPAFGRPRTPAAGGWEWIVRQGRVVAIGQGGVDIPDDGWVLSAQGPVVQALLSLKVGDPVEGRWRLVPDWIAEGLQHAIGGGPRLLSAGRMHITAEEERFGSDIRHGRAPRSAIGLTRDGQVLLVTVSGRQPGVSVGVTLQELAEILLELGAVEAMNLDGGGSSTLVVGGRVINLPSGGVERPVGNSLVVLPPPAASGDE